MYPISVLCQVMEVSTSGFYDYVGRVQSGSENQEQQELVLRVKAIHERTGGVSWSAASVTANSTRTRRSRSVTKASNASAFNAS